jgi:predicted HAD superfamily Cof-like phosphohydrolase
LSIRALLKIVKTFLGNREVKGVIFGSKISQMSEKLTLIQTITMVREFHEAFLIPNNDAPTLLEQPDFELRHRLMHEENEEYLEACKKGDLVEIADALGDQLYILCGTLLRHGLQHKIEEVFHEIQRSNMSKLDENGKPIFREDGKVMKSSLYFRPDIKRIIEKG